MSHLEKENRSMFVRRLAGCVLCASAAFVLAQSPAWAGSSQRTGTNGAHELRLPVGPRGTALGGSVVSDISGIESMFWNPAGLGTIEGTELMFTNTQYIADMKVNYAAVATHAGGLGVLGLSVKVLSIGDIVVTTEDAPDGTGEILKPTFTVIGGSWARQFTDRVLFGASAQFVSERIAQVSANGVAFDFGVQYATGLHGFKLGLAMKNFGSSMEFGGPGFETSVLPPGSDPSASNRVLSSNSSSFEMPSFFTLAAAYDVVSNAKYRLALFGGFQNNNFSFDDVNGAAELTFRGLYSLRASYFASFGSSTDVNGNEGSTEWTSGDDIYTGWALGAGAQLKTGERGRLGIDAAWRPIKDFFDDTFEIGLKLAF
jgi:hypothetical protein